MLNRAVVCGSVAPQAQGNRVEYRRGEITEWYVNGLVGLEQGVTLHSAPARGDAAGPLTIALRLVGGLECRG